MDLCYEYLAESRAVALGQPSWAIDTIRLRVLNFLYLMKPDVSGDDGEALLARKHNWVVIECYITMFFIFV